MDNVFLMIAILIQYSLIKDILFIISLIELFIHGMIIILQKNRIYLKLHK